VRDNTVVNFLGTHILKQAQWTSIVVFILLIPISFIVMRLPYARPVPEGEVAITYGIKQKPKAIAKAEETDQSEHEADNTESDGGNTAAETAPVGADTSATSSADTVDDDSEDSE
jgi:phosphatidylglycerol:prolipoprotein diacylglycerol transferase